MQYLHCFDALNVKYYSFIVSVKMHKTRIQENRKNARENF
jgi:hypothetical protein